MTASFGSLSEDDARAILGRATEAAAWQLRHAVADGQTPAQVLLTSMLSAAVTAKALELDEAMFLEGCRAAFSSVRVLPNARPQ